MPRDTSEDQLKVFVKIETLMPQTFEKTFFAMVAVVEGKISKHRGKVTLSLWQSASKPGPFYICFAFLIPGIARTARAANDPMNYSGLFGKNGISREQISDNATLPPDLEPVKGKRA